MAAKRKCYNIRQQSLAVGALLSSSVDLRGREDARIVAVCDPKAGWALSSQGLKLEKVYTDYSRSSGSKLIW
jgi:hypothetical protein